MRAILCRSARARVDDHRPVSLREPVDEDLDAVLGVFDFSTS
jgi:hypothetical protein